MLTTKLTVSLGDTFDLILLLDGVGVGGLLGAVGELISQALSDGLDGSEGSQSGTSGDQVDGLVHTADRGHIDGLTADGTGGTDLTGVLTRTTVLHGIDQDLDGVDSRVQEADDLQGLLDNADGLQLLTVVASVHHQGASHALDDRAQSLAESALLVSASSVRHVDTGNGGVSGGRLDVIDQRDLGAEKLVELPLSEELRLHGVLEVDSRHLFCQISN